MSLPKYAVAAAAIRAQIAAGLLLPGEPAPSGAALSRTTGYSALTCRKALRTLISQGVLVPGVSPNARAHVAPPAPAAGEAAAASAARALSVALADRRHAAGLTQPQLASIVGVSVTTVGHAETGRLWQSRRFWEQADKELNAYGQLLALHQAYRTAAAPADTADAAEETSAGAAVGTPPEIMVTLSGPVASVTVTWANGEAVTVYPPGTLTRPAGTTLGRQGCGLSPLGRRESLDRESCKPVTAGLQAARTPTSDRRASTEQARLENRNKPGI